MTQHEALIELMDKLLMTIQTPIAHAYGYTELLQHEIHKDEMDIKQVDGDIDKIKIYLSRVLTEVEGIVEDYEHLKK